MLETRRGRAGALAVPAVCTLALSPVPGADSPAAPPIRFTTDEAFEAGKIPACAGRHDAAYAYRDAHLGEHLVTST